MKVWNSLCLKPNKCGGTLFLHSFDSNFRPFLFSWFAYPPWMSFSYICSSIILKIPVQIGNPITNTPISAERPDKILWTWFPKLQRWHQKPKSMSAAQSVSWYSCYTVNERRALIIKIITPPPKKRGAGLHDCRYKFHSLFITPTKNKTNRIHELSRYNQLFIQAN